MLKLPPLSYTIGVMKRYALDKLNSWYNSARRKPLIIRGARQVGKSTLVRKFAEAEGLKLYEVNLERNPKLEKSFSTLDPKLILQELEATVGKKIDSEKSLLFLDEIQATPSAVSALRYFFEDNPNLAIVAAGSLLEFVLRDHDFSMPVGRIQYLHLEPMTFSEFLLGIGENFLHEQIIDWNSTVTISQTAHEKLIQHLRMFFLCGGMPEAVLAYRETKSLEECKAVHVEILSTYFDDFPKYKTRIDPLTLRQVFDAIPQAVGRKMKYSSFAPDLRSTQIRNCIELLSLARVITQVTHSTCNGLPVKAGEQKSIYKLLYLDTGLLLNALGLDLAKLGDFTHEQLVNKGTVAEHFIGQHLVARASANNDRSLNYWLREGKSNNAEVDYVIVEKGEIIPIEVKAGKSGTLRSLRQFMLKHNSKYALRFDLNLPTVQTIPNEETDYKLCSLPIYLVEVLGRCFE